MNAELSINAQRITISLEASQMWPVIHLLSEAKAVVSRESLHRIIPKNLRVVLPLHKPEIKPSVPAVYVTILSR